MNTEGARFSTHTPLVFLVVFVVVVVLFGVRVGRGEIRAKSSPLHVKSKGNIIFFDFRRMIYNLVRHLNTH